MAFGSCGEAWAGPGKNVAWLRPADGFGQARVFTAADVSCFVIPDGCVGLPTLMDRMSNKCLFCCFRRHFKV